MCGPSLYLQCACLHVCVCIFQFVIARIPQRGTRLTFAAFYTPHCADGHVRAHSRANGCTVCAAFCLLNYC